MQANVVPILMVITIDCWAGMRGGGGCKHYDAADLIKDVCIGIIDNYIDDMAQTHQRIL